MRSVAASLQGQCDFIVPPHSEPWWRASNLLWPDCEGAPGGQFSFGELRGLWRELREASGSFGGRNFLFFFPGKLLDTYRKLLNLDEKFLDISWNYNTGKFSRQRRHARDRPRTLQEES